MSGGAPAAQPGALCTRCTSSRWAWGSSAADDAQREPWRGSLLHQPGDLLTVEVVGVNMVVSYAGHRPGCSADQHEIITVQSPHLAAIPGGPRSRSRVARERMGRNT